MSRGRFAQLGDLQPYFPIAAANGRVANRLANTGPTRCRSWCRQTLIIRLKEAGVRLSETAVRLAAGRTSVYSHCR